MKKTVVAVEVYAKGDRVRVRYALDEKFLLATITSLSPLAAQSDSGDRSRHWKEIKKASQ